MSLESLAAKSGVSRATLSKIERGERNPSITAAAAVADALDAPLADLLGEQAAPAIQVVRGESSALLVDSATGAIRESILLGIEGIEVVRYTLRAHTSTGPFHPHAVGTREIFIVLEGAVEVRAGRRKLELAAGDIAAVPGDVSHAITNLQDETTRLLLLIVRAA